MRDIISKKDFIDYVIENNYEYHETKDEINLNKIKGKLANVDKTITYYKNDGSVQICLSDSGSDKRRWLNNFELNCISIFASMRGMLI